MDTLLVYFSKTITNFKGKHRTTTTICVRCIMVIGKAYSNVRDVCYHALSLFDLILHCRTPCHATIHAQSLPSIMPKKCSTIFFPRKSYQI